MSDALAGALEQQKRLIERLVRERDAARAEVANHEDELRRRAKSWDDSLKHHGRSEYERGRRSRDGEVFDLRAEVEQLIEALFIFADEGEEIRVGNYTITWYGGEVGDDDGWMVFADGSAHGVVHADFDDAVRAALARLDGEED